MAPVLLPAPAPPFPAVNSLPLEQYLDAIIDGSMSLQDVLKHAMAVAAGQP
jgi:hypothetical protein